MKIINMIARKLFFIGIVFCLLFSCGAQASLAQTYEETRLTSNAADQTTPRIFSTNVIWLDWRNDADGNWVTGGGSDSRNKMDVYLYDLTSGTEKRLTDDVALPTHAEVTSSHVFWLDARADAPGLYAHSLLDGATSLAASISGYAGSFDKAGNRLAAWTDKAVYAVSGLGGIYYYDDATKSAKKLADAFVNGLDFSDGKAVWTNAAIGTSNIYSYDIAAGQKTQLTTDNSAAPFDSNVSSGGNKIIWLAGSSQTNMKFNDTFTGKVETLTAVPALRLNPRVSGQKVVWSTFDSDLGRYVADVYDFDAKTITTVSQEQGLNPDVDGAKVVFQSNRNNNNDIYLIDLSKLVTPVAPVQPVEQPKNAPAGIVSGDLIKGSTAAVYYFGADGKRYVFPNYKCYNTWYADFSKVKKVSDADLAEIEIGGNVTYRPGVKMIKAQSSNKVYAVDQGGMRRWVSSADAAKAVYGAAWNKQIDDVPDAFWTNYQSGADVVSSIDFNAAAVTSASPDINIDKGLK